MTFVSAFLELILTTKAQTKDSDPVKAWSEALEDMNYEEQQLVIWAHMSLEDCENADLETLEEVMSARAKKNRPQSLWDFAGSIETRGRR